MENKNICPECKGKRKFKIQVSEYWEEPIRYEYETCYECDGRGYLDNFEMAIYTTRGEGSPPSNKIGYA